MRIAIQGEYASYHHLAAERHFGQDIDLVCCETFAEVFEALADGQADAAVVATENSIAGTIKEVQQLLDRYKFRVAAEVAEPIHHCLIGLPGATLPAITHVFSHPMALPQCSVFLDEYLPRAERVEFHDTAASVTHIKHEHNPHYAAIASHLAAELEGLPILHENIEDDPENITRFAVLERP